MQEAEPAGIPVQAGPTASDSLAATMRLLCLWVGLASLVVLLLELLLAPSGHSEAHISALLSAVAWGCWYGLRQRRLTPEVVALVLVLIVIAAAILSVITYGSIRTSVSVLFVAAVVGAGIFLGRRIMRVVLAGIVGLLGVLTWIESTGGLGTRPDFTVGWRDWFTHSVALVVVGLVVLHSRGENQRALAQLRAELERRRQIEHERDRNLARFALIFRSSPSPMIAQSAHSAAILDVNPAFERVYGYRREQVLGRDDLFLWADPMERERHADRLMRERHVEHGRYRARRADGSTFEALVSTSTGSDPEDRLIISTITDVTSREELLERLRRSEALFATAFNFAPLNLTITRLSDGTFLEVNRADDRVQGMQPTELKGRTTIETGVWLTPDDRARFVERLRQEGRLHAYDTRMRHKDGRIVDARLWAELIEIDGEPCALVSSFNVEREKRREALLLEVAKGVAAETGEAFFSALAHHLSDAIEADQVMLAEVREGSSLDTLAVWRDGRLGRNFTFSVVGTPCEDTLQRDGPLTCPTGLSSAYPNAPQLRAQGYEAYLGQALRDADGQTIGLLMAMWRKPLDVRPDTEALLSIFASRAQAELVRLRRDREIAQLNETLEQRVRERTAELQKLNAELDAFAYSVSHDLKSPLRAIDGFTRLLQEQLDGRLDDDARDLLDRVIASTRRMGAIINDLLALARVSQGQLKRVDIDLSELARHVAQMELARQPERQVRLDIEPGLMAHVDPDLARIALENLFGNALKYTRLREQAHIAFGLDPSQGNGAPRVYLRDDGTGFDMAYVGQLFKPFQRLHRPSEFEGTGIGLATVRRIIERHGGSIGAEGRPGEGATFWFDFGPAALWRGGSALSARAPDRSPM